LGFTQGVFRRVCAVTATGEQLAAHPLRRVFLASRPSGPLAPAKARLKRTWLPWEPPFRLRSLRCSVGSNPADQEAVARSGGRIASALGPWDGRRRPQFVEVTARHRIGIDESQLTATLSRNLITGLRPRDRAGFTAPEPPLSNGSGQRDSNSRPTLRGRIDEGTRQPRTRGCPP